MKIRYLKPEDLESRVNWMNDSRVFSSMHYAVPVMIDNTKIWYGKVIADPSRSDMAFEDEYGELIAMGGLTHIADGRAELYVFVHPDKQGKGFGAKATSLLCHYGFERLGLKQIYLYTNLSNLAAQHIYLKCGFKLANILKAPAGGEVEDRLYYELTGPLDGAILPITKIKINDRPLMIVRDDLFPAVGGGNKARKAEYYERAMREGGYNACVTTGGIQSNHNRAIALMCARNGWHCHNVYHGTEERFLAEKGNALLVRKSGASYEFVDAEGIGEAMDAAMRRLESEGYHPMYIHGGGHDLPGGMAFVDAVRQLKECCDAIDYKPDYIFHASGTGSTQAGIAVGLDLVGWSDVNLVGISVARQKERGTHVIENFANILSEHYGLSTDYRDRINFITDYLCGGYEKFTPEMLAYLDGVMRRTGIMFDTTYSGKAFYGMMDYLTRNCLTGNVMFWHTGGLMNLMK